MINQNINLTSSTKLIIPDKQVVRLIAKTLDDDVSLKLNVGAGAGVHLIAPISPKVSSYQIEVGERTQFTFSLVGLITSQKSWHIEISLIGEQASANIELAIIGEIYSDIKFNIYLEHLAARTVGRIKARRVQFGTSVSELVGMLKVDKQAHGTDTYLSDKTLLLGELSQAKSDPRLEILADDVKASHGATIGRLGEDELFYLRSRGLPKSLAEAILVQSFLTPALIGVPLEIRDKLLHEVSIRQNT